ncbi:phosphatase PAP2 family protein [Actinophytocola glycyrrhizae]|uniref:Phosphatase PAP2 family protein n=1 Tax=Actinophytocola glycyrrhizae TaxID=2044873 RepID=A0ABV9RTZ5_9PSEU
MPVYTAPGMSFPSGHAMSSLVSYGVLLLVFTPLLRPATRRATIAVVATLVFVIGFTRMALGVHYLSDVVAGWLLGCLWLLLTTFAFRRWRQEAHVPAAGPCPGRCRRRTWPTSGRCPTTIGECCTTPGRAWACSP